MFLLSTSSLNGYGLHRIFSLAKEGGFDGLDLSVDFDTYDTYDTAYLDSLVQMTNLPIASITAPQRRLTKKQCDTIMQIANDLGVATVNFHPPHRLEKEKDWFGEYLQNTAKKYSKLIVNIVNAPPKIWLFIISEYGDARPETIKKITKRTALSIANVDPSSGVDLMKTFILLGSTMNLVYLSDKKEGIDGLFPGEGNMPLESLLIKLKDIGYKGNFTLSITPDQLMVGSNDISVITKKMQQSREFLEKYFKGS